MSTDRLPWAESQAGLQAAYNAGVSDGQRETQHANLGLATAVELLDELRTRIELDYFAGGGGLDYTTVRGRPEQV